MKRLAAVAALAALLAAPPATAGAKLECVAPASALETAGSLPRVAAAFRRGQPLRVLVVGSASSGGSGTSGPGKPYPVKLIDRLHTALGVPVTVDSIARRGWTAEAMAEEMPDLVAAEQPDLVIWQTGTVDAVREIAPEAFGAALLKGTEALQRARVDVLFMDMQFSPMGARLIDYAPYLEYMGWVAGGKGVPVFHRHAIMRSWSEEDRFGGSARAKLEQQAFADHVHACIAELVARVVRTVADATPR